MAKLLPHLLVLSERRRRPPHIMSAQLRVGACATLQLPFFALTLDFRHDCQSRRFHSELEVSSATVAIAKARLRGRYPVGLSLPCPSSHLTVLNPG
eukprot:4479746-Alexandrium_andersonii.AAC.1